jgi:hypothetical protein
VTKKISLAISAFFLLAVSAFGQASMTSTTLSNAIDNKQTSFALASATGVSAPGLPTAQGGIGSASGSALTVVYVDREAMEVAAINGTTVTVRRARQGTEARAHVSGSRIYVGPASYYAVGDPSGACTAANLTVLPRVVIPTGRIFDCQNGTWGQVADYVYWLSADNCEFRPETLTTTNTRVQLGAAGVPVLNGVSNAAAGTEHLVCTILPPTRGTVGRGALLKDIVVYVGSQTVAPTSIGTPTLGTISFATPGTAAVANTVTPVTIGGTVTKVTATAVTTVTTAGAFVPVSLTFSTIVDLSLDYTVLVLDFPLVQSAASAMTVNTPGLFVHYRAPLPL